MTYRGTNYALDGTQCSFCPSETWKGYHQGNRTIVRVCPTCAVRHLPALMADSLWSEKWTYEIGDRDWNWAGVVFAHALRRHAETQPRSLSRFDGLPSPSSKPKGGANV